MTRFRLPAALRGDTAGGVLLLTAAVTALGWANSPWRDSYQSLLDVEVGPASFGLHLSLAHWASDGLLAIFFFVVGAELKEEMVAGRLRDPRQAGVPIAAAVGGMITPALLYVAVVAATDTPALHGWAIPTATDIAFALAVLAVFGRGLPSALRVFLMTLAVVDDLLGIIVIATVYTEHIDFVMLAAGLGCVVVFALLARTRTPRWWLLIPVAVAAWAFVHASGVHATVAGVLLGFAVPAVVMRGESTSRAVRFGHLLGPVSSLVALPLFAFAAAGVTVVGTDGAVQAVTGAVFAGLVVGKVAGVMGTAALVTRLTPLRLADGITLRDLLPIGLLTGIGFTVALLIAELSFDEPGDAHAVAAKVGILAGSLTAAVLGALALRRTSRRLDVARV